MTTILSTPQPTRSPAATARWRRALTIALGVVWLLDAGLQYQSYMFTKAFPEQVIVPAGAGSPAWIAAPDRWAGHLMAHHIVVLNALFATIQLALGIGLLFRRTTRAALAASVVWALSVWWLGEGLGGLFAGPDSAVVGVPGGAVIYALIAVLLWPPREEPDAASAGESGPLGVAGARGLWIVFWALLAYETLRPANRAAHALAQQVAGGADGEPRWLARLDHWGAHHLVAHGLSVSIALAVVFGLLAISVVARLDRRPVLIVGVVVALLIWVVGQDFGGIFTGQGTDPNSGLLLVLFALCFWPVGMRRFRPVAAQGFWPAGTPRAAVRPALVDEAGVGPAR